MLSRGAKNHPPVADNDVNGKDRVVEDDGRGHGDPTAKGNVLANDTDKDHDTLKVLKPGTFEGDFGTLRLSANGKWTYTLDDDNKKVDALGDGDNLFDTFKYTATDGHGGTDSAVLKIKIEGSDDPPKASIKLDAVTADNVVNATEADADVNITGTVGGNVKDGDTVTLTVNGTDFQGAVASGHFSIAVSGFQLSVDGDLKIEASVTTSDGAGHSTTASATKTYAVDITPPTATIALDAVTTDNIVNSAEGASTVTITGVVGGDVKNGDTVTVVVNGTSYTGAASNGQFSIDVAGSDLLADGDKIIQASVTTADHAGNATTVADTQSYLTDTTPPVATLTLDAITANNIVERTESGADIAVTGAVTGDVKNGDIVTLVVNGHNYSGVVTSNAFSILVAGSDLLADADKTVQANVAISDAAGNTANPGDGQAYTFDLNLDLSSLAASQGFIIQGDTAYDQAGFSVSSAGDVNGDGFDDLIVGANAGDDGGTSAGEAYVVFGTASGFGTTVGGRNVIDLTTLSAAQGFIIQGAAAGDQAGASVSSAGDVNGDGFDDLIVGATYGDDGGADAGTAYIVFGTASGFGTADSSGRHVIDLTTLAAAQGFMIQGDAADDRAGSAVSSAGDVNGDGFDDLIVGARYGDDGGSLAGEAYVVFGTASSFGTPIGGKQVIDLTTLSASQGFVIQGDAAGDKAGFSVSSAGDVNGDGFEDLIVGAMGGNDGGNLAGEAYVVFGTASGFGTADGSGRRVVDLTTLTATQGFVIQGDTAGDRAGFSVSSAGDVNGDGFDDLIVGAATGDDGGSNAGEAYVVFGTASGFGTADGSGRRVVDLTTLTAAHGFIIQGAAAYDEAGWSVSAAGDVNGDGFDDLIVGARGGSAYAGEAYVVFGTSKGFGTSVGGRQVLDLTTLSATQGFIIQGDTASDQAGQSVSSAGDVNGDGFDDLIVGAPRGDDGGKDAGEAYIVYGGAFTGNAPITTTGTTAAEILIGGLGGDTLTGGGGADIIRSGAGNDTIGVTGTAFVKIDGGTGYDTLRMDGASDVFDFATIKNTAIDSIEAIDMGVSGSQRIVLAKHDVFHLSDDTSGGMTRLTIHGGTTDTVSTVGSGWAANGTTTIGSDTFRIFDNGHAELLVDSDVTLSGTLGGL
jgi:VCBS repeat-containing protein